MESFRWIATAFSMVLGLGVTRVLSGLVAVFRSRQHATIHAEPIVWALSIFVLQLQFWWALIELAGVQRVWTLPEFLLVLGIPLSLFVAAALVLPAAELKPGENLPEVFERDGRFGLVCLAVYAGLAFTVDRLLFETVVASRIDIFLVLELVVPLFAFFSRSSSMRSAAAVLYLLLVLATSWDLSPKAY